MSSSSHRTGETNSPRSWSHACTDAKAQSRFRSPISEPAQQRQVSFLLLCFVNGAFLNQIVFQSSDLYFEACMMKFETIYQLRLWSIFLLFNLKQMKHFTYFVNSVFCNWKDSLKTKGSLHLCASRILLLAYQWVGRGGEWFEFEGGKITF